jgi:hypothetical protein
MDSRSKNGPAPYLETAIDALAKGDTKAALVAASEACYRAPDKPEPHYAYGQDCPAAGLPASAGRVPVKNSRRFAAGAASRPVQPAFRGKHRRSSKIRLESRNNSRIIGTALVLSTSLYSASTKSAKNRAHDPDMKG